tara:strand:- start:108 stop:323 length:216 start_codon:yes stop_codon:yes gene_type:complete
MKNIKLTDDQVDVLAEALIYMGTEWRSTFDDFNQNRYDPDYWTEARKKELRKNYFVAKKILPKLGLSRDNF